MIRPLRRLLALLAFLSTVILLVRFRSSVESTVIETTFDAVAYAQALEEEAAAKLRQLPQVILPFHASDEDSDKTPAATGSPKANKPSASGGRPGFGAGSKKPVIEPLIVTEKGDDGNPIRNMGAFWKKWSPVLYEARPNVSKILLSGRAQAYKPPGGEMYRQPYRNHIRQSLEELDHMRQAHAKLLEKVEEELGDGPKGISPRRWKGLDIFKGRGIVMVGGGEYFGPAIVSLHMLRRTGSTLPVEVFVPDDAEYEKQICDVYFKKLDAKCVVLSHIFGKSKLKTGQSDDADMKVTHYQLKSLALLLSSFSDALLLDSDSIPLTDPAETLFDAEPYTSKGMVVWPDFWRATESPKFWTIAGKTSFPSDLPATASEAGQLAVNKATHLAPLLLSAYYNIFGPDHYYPLLSQGALGQGDKETFLAAAVVLNSTYYRVKTNAGTLGRNDGTGEHNTALLQHSPADDHRYHSSSSSSPPSQAAIRPMFLHSNTPKMNAGHLVDEGDLVAADGETRLRLLGSKESAQKLFGFDVERTIWELLVQTGCELQNVLAEWKTRERMCDRLQEHYQAVFS